MIKYFLFPVIMAFVTIAVGAQLPAADYVKVRGGKLTIQPITHATLVLQYKNKNIYIDPTGGAAAFTGLGAPDIILITDIHGDHMDPKTIEAINTKNATLIVPQAVADKLPATINKQNIVVLNNGNSRKTNGFLFEAIPMYNLPQAADAYHTKGRGNGYVLTIGGKRLYISGDTEDIPEMRSLQNIDYAFVCMNLPYTMDANQAAQGVLEFAPSVVYPYHHRGQNVENFKTIVNQANKKIEVRLLNWYPAAKS